MLGTFGVLALGVFGGSWEGSVIGPRVLAIDALETQVRTYERCV